MESARHRDEQLAHEAHVVTWLLSAEGQFVSTLESTWVLFTGQSVTECCGNGWLNAYHVDDRGRISALIQQHEKDTVRFFARLWSLVHLGYRTMRCSADAIRDGSGLLMQWRGISCDETELRTIETKYEQTVLHFSLALSSADAGSFRLERADGMITELTLDERAKCILGFSALENVTLQAFLQRVTSSDAPYVAGEISSILENKATHLELHFRVDLSSTNQSAIRFVEMKGELVCLPSGRHVVHGILSDETKRTAAEQKRIQLEQERTHKAEELRAQQKDFLDTICHEMRNPLQGTVGALSMLREVLERIAPQVSSLAAPAVESSLSLEAVSPIACAFHYLDVIDECSLQQKNIAEDVLDFSRLGDGKITLRPTFFPLQRLLHSLATTYAASIKLRKLALHIRAPEEVSIRADYGRLLQIFVNLLSNAIKFTPAGGSITITVSIEANPCLLVSTIQDSGIGMDEAQLASLFQRFITQQSKNEGVGGGASGLGLLVAKKFVDLMNGTLRYTSEKGCGTIAKLILPTESRTVDSQKPFSENEWSHSRTLAQKLHVLAVDDNDVIRLILERILQSIGCTYASARNGAEAVDLAKQRNIHFHAVLMDIHMPVLDGIEATRRIRHFEQQERRVPLKIIGLSGDARPEQRAAALEAGMNVFLTKPYQREAIIDVLSAVGSVN